jgi:hypothetical protein
MSRLHALRTLSPLKQLAYKRICQAQDALGKKGCIPRYATETELVAKNVKGEVVWNPIQIDDFKNAFKNSPYISAITAEGDSAFLTGHKDFNQMEVVINGNGIGRTSPLHMPDERLTPKRIVPATDIVKHQLKTYCKDHGIHEISFEARPQTGWISGINSGYHSNMSLYNATGENLFGQNPELLKHCASELLNSQAEASIMLLPTAESLNRISPFGLSALGGTPSHINHTYGKFNSTLGFGSLATRRTNALTPYMNTLRDKFPATDQLFRSFAERSPDFNRIENRLAGADSCPYMVGAFDVPTLEHAINTFTGKAAPLGRLHLPKSVEEAVEIFSKSDRMRHVLGEELHNAYLAQYLEPIVKSAERIR